MKPLHRSLPGKLFLAGAVVFGLVQFIRPGIPAAPAAHPIQAPPNVQHILEKNCYSCHSDERRLAWFDQIQPGYSLVRYDILTAREHLNFSTIGAKPAAAQKAALYEAVNMIQLGAMPLPRFTALHPDAKVTPEELAELKAYLAPWTGKPNQPDSLHSGGGAKRTDAAPASVPANEPGLPSLNSVRPEFNGVSFDPTFEGWKLLSITDRGDNHTFRFVLGNAIAVNAARSGRISPWPDGTRFAKIAWQQEQGSDGLFHPGKFVQVELMIKDAQRYKRTDGWGWGRWRGLDLKPYGRDARFVQECTGCHLPVRGNDYVYTEPITTAAVKGDEIVNGAAAALPASLPFQPLPWSPVTLSTDPKMHTMSVLMRNTAAPPRSGMAPAAGYPAGTMLALVTWRQREDPHWFGARIPGDPLSVEFVQIGSDGRTENYHRYAGAGLGETKTAPQMKTERMQMIGGLLPARMP